MSMGMTWSLMVSGAVELQDPVPGIDTVCLFCGEEIGDQGLGFYDHVETHPACEFRWKHWMIEIPKDHGGA